MEVIANLQYTGKIDSKILQPFNDDFKQAYKILKDAQEGTNFEKWYKDKMAYGNLKKRVHDLNLDK